MISEDKTQNQEYIIKVTKTKDLELANTNLEILAIEGNMLNPPFDNSIIQYHTEITNDTDKLNIFAIPENEKGKVKISGNSNLKEGNNKITITVTAPNGITKREYQVNVYKRNVQEEKKYQKELDEREEKLQQAYDIEKISTKNDRNNSDQSEQKRKNKSYIIIGAIIAIIIVATIVEIIYYKKYKNGKQITKKNVS